MIQTQSITETSSPVFRPCGPPEVLSLAKVSGKSLPAFGPFTENGPVQAPLVELAETGFRQAQQGELA
jgi:hypothetical protein